MKYKNIQVIIMAILSASAVVLLCGVAEFSGYETWQKTVDVPVVKVAVADIPVLPSIPPVEIALSESPAEVPPVEPDLPVLPGADDVAEEFTVVDEPVYFQLQYLPTRHGYVFGHERKVLGLALGYYLPQNEICGVSLALMHMYNMRKYGLSFSLLEMSGEIGGVTFFLAGGAVSNYGLTVGLLNMSENNHGLQIGLVNMNEQNLLLDYPQKPRGEEEESSFGIQAGLINFSDAPGIQFGLWNINSNGWLKHFPLINFCF